MHALKLVSTLQVISWVFALDIFSFLFSLSSFLFYWGVSDALPRLYRCNPTFVFPRFLLACQVTLYGRYSHVSISALQYTFSRIYRVICPERDHSILSLIMSVIGNSTDINGLGGKNEKLDIKERRYFWHAGKRGEAVAFRRAHLAVWIYLIHSLQFKQYAALHSSNCFASVFLSYVHVQGLALV